MPKQEQPSTWETVSEKLRLDCKVYRIYERLCKHPIDGRQSDFYVMEAPDWVQVLALTPQQKLVVVNQFRHGSGRLSWEVPGGVVEAGEDPLEAGLRELREETGYCGENPRMIGKAMPNPALMNNFTHFLLVENCRITGDRSLDPNEEIEYTERPVREVLDLCRSGEIYHSITLNALFFLERELEQKGS